MKLKQNFLKLLFQFHFNVWIVLEERCSPVFVLEQAQKNFITRSVLYLHFQHNKSQLTVNIFTTPLCGILAYSAHSE